MRRPPLIPLFCAVSLSGPWVLPSAIAAAVEYPCVIKPSQTVDVSVDTLGLVRDVMVDRGDIVARGDVLVRLRDDTIRAQLALAQRRAEDTTQIGGAEERLQLFEAQLARARELQGKSLLTQREFDAVESQMIAVRQELDRARADRELAQLEVARVQSLLDQHVVHSPIDGIVAQRNVDPGEYTSEEKPLLTVVTLDPLDVEVFVPQAMSGRLALGDAAVVVPETAPELRLKATIDVVDRVFDAASGTFGSG